MINVPLVFVAVNAIRTKILAISLRLRAVGAELLVVAGKLRLVVIDVALIGIAVRAVLVQIAPIVIDVPLVGVAVGAILRQIPLIMIDIALIGIAIRAVLREIFLIASNVFLVVLNILLLRSRIRALGIGAPGEQTGNSNREHPSTDHKFCVHGSLLIELNAFLASPPHLGNQTPAAIQSFATGRTGVLRKD